ncbi:MAG: MaoC family dehydratase N-terminal domain-containing protein [Candidatus Binatota bacterium]
MTEPLENLKSYIGRSETAADVVTGSAMVKIAAALGLDNPASAKGDPIPPGWYGAFFPPSHRPSQMRADGQAAGHGFLPPVPLPRRRLGGVRMSFYEPLRIGDEITRVSEIADISVDEDASGSMVHLVERNSISNSRGLAVVEERDLIWLSEGRAAAKSAPAPAAPAEAAWRRVVEPNPVLLFRFSAIRFNSHRIHYDRDYVTKVEGLPGLAVQGTLVSQLLIEMCRSELPARKMTYFGYQAVRQLYDTGPFTIAGAPAAGGEAALWAVAADGTLAMTATAKFA